MIRVRVLMKCLLASATLASVVGCSPRGGTDVSCANRWDSYETLLQKIGDDRTTSLSDEENRLASDVSDLHYLGWLSWRAFIQGDPERQGTALMLLRDAGMLERTSNAVLIGLALYGTEPERYYAYKAIGKQTDSRVLQAMEEVVLRESGQRDLMWGAFALEIIRMSDLRRAKAIVDSYSGPLSVRKRYLEVLSGSDPRLLRE